MAQCFQLLDKQTNEAVSLSVIDEQICNEVLHTPVHPKYYGGDKFNWFDTIGFQIATGKDLHSEELVNHYNNDLWADEYPLVKDIVSFLRERYVSRSFYGR